MKKFLITVLSLAMLLCIGIAAAGCEDEKPKEEVKEGTFYTLQEAYDLELLTTEDLQTIANYNNNEINYPEELESSVADSIKKAAAAELRNREINPIADADESGIKIITYLGAYNECYVVSIDNIYDVRPTDVPNIWVTVGGVDIHHTNFYKIVIWTTKQVEKGKDYYLAHSNIVSLEQAYNSGALNENDLMHISYYLNHEVYKASAGNESDSSKWIKVNFIPEQAIPELSAGIKNDIKSAYYYRNLQAFQDSDGTNKYDKDIIDVEYLGCYNGCYVARIDSDYWNYGASVYTVFLGGIVWEQSYPSIQVFTFKN